MDCYTPRREAALRAANGGERRKPPSSAPEVTTPAELARYNGFLQLREPGAVQPLPSPRCMTPLTAKQFRVGMNREFGIDKDFQRPRPSASGPTWTTLSIPSPTPTWTIPRPRRTSATSWSGAGLPSLTTRPPAGLGDLRDPQRRLCPHRRPHGVKTRQPRVAFSRPGHFCATLPHLPPGKGNTPCKNPQISSTLESGETTPCGQKRHMPLFPLEIQRGFQRKKDTLPRLGRRTP